MTKIVPFVTKTARFFFAYKIYSVKSVSTHGAMYADGKIRIDDSDQVINENKREVYLCYLST